MKFKDLERRIAKLEPVHHTPKFHIPGEHFKESLDFIHETLIPEEITESTPTVDWIAAELKGDRKTADKLKSHPDVKKYQIFGED